MFPSESRMITQTPELPSSSLPDSVVIVGVLPSFPSLPSLPSLTNVRPVSVPAGSCVITHVPVLPSESSPRSVVTDGFLPSLMIVSVVSPPGFTTLTV